MPIRHAIWKVGTKPEPPPFKKGSPHRGGPFFYSGGGNRSAASAVSGCNAARDGRVSEGRGDSGKKSSVAGDLTPSPGSGDKGVREDPERPFRIR
jgi:hypothetical protein